VTTALLALACLSTILLIALVLIVREQLAAKDAWVEAQRRDIEAERLTWTQERLGMLERLDALRVPSLVVAEPVPPPPAIQTDVSEEAEYLANERERLASVLAENGFE
jgi:cell division septation protein DedD